MTFTGAGIGLLQIIIFFSNSIKNIFIGLDNIQFFDSPFSLLDIFIALILWDLISWFIIRVITGKNLEKEGFESEQAKYDQYGESYHTAATDDEIDFSNEVLHE